MAYRIMEIPMTSDDLQSHATNARLSKCDFLVHLRSSFTRFQVT